MNALLPRRIPKEPKRASRWRSQAHLSFVRDHCCSVCGSSTNVEAAHVRMGSRAGMGQKPDDWRSVSLCAGPNSSIDGQLGCHNRQHLIGEPAFWKGRDVEALIAAFVQASPKRRDIEQAMKERSGAA